MFFFKQRTISSFSPFHPLRQELKVPCIHYTIPHVRAFPQANSSPLVTFPKEDNAAAKMGQ
jgi:hypothetical protein